MAFYSQSVSAIHRALGISEVLQLIFAELYSMKTFGTLGSASVVCQSFKDPALDLLWYHLFGLFPLLSTLPLEAKGNNLWFLKPDISEASWARFDSYARRVRMFSDAPPTLHRDIHQTVFIELARARKMILPHLRSVQISTLRPTTSLELMLCLPKSIRSFQAHPFLDDEFFDLSDSQYHIGAALDLLSSRGDPNLQELTLGGMILPVSYPRKLLLFPHLRTLRINLVKSDPQAREPHWLCTLSLLPCLETLEIFIAQGEVFKAVSPGGFPSLRNIDILILKPECETLTRFLNALPPTSLSKLTIRDNCAFYNEESLVTVPAHFQNWTLCFTAIARQKFLEAITLIPFGDWDDNSFRQQHPTIRLLDVVKPLLSVKGLQYLDFGELVGMALSDDDVLKLAKAWPNLKELNLGFGVDTEKPSFIALHHLAVTCPMLDELGLAIDTTKEVPLLKVPPHSDHPLTVYTMYESPLKDTKKIAQQLMALFPELSNIRAGDEEAAQEIEDILYESY